MYLILQSLTTLTHKIDFYHKNDKNNDLYAYDGTIHHDPNNVDYNIHTWDDHDMIYHLDHLHFHAASTGHVYKPFVRMERPEIKILFLDNFNKELMNGELTFKCSMQMSQ